MTGKKSRMLMVRSVVLSMEDFARVEAGEHVQDASPRGGPFTKVAPMPVKRPKAAIIGCQAANQSGGPCAAPPVHHSHYCSLHLVPGRAAELGKRGGQQSRSALDDGSSEPIAIPATASDVQHLLAEAVALTRAGRMSPKVGTALSYMAMALLKAFEVADFDRRLRDLEQFSRRADEADQAPVLRPPEPTPEEWDRIIEAELSGSAARSPGSIDTNQS